MSSNLIYSPSAARVLNTIPPNEHTAGDRTPYCYLIGWTKLNMWYYGRRTAEGCHPSEFWKKYKTSSNHVTNFVQVYGDPDHIEIRQVFHNTSACECYESRLLEKIDASNNVKFLNKTNGDELFGSTSLISVTHKKTGKKSFIPTKEYQNNKNEYTFHTQGMIVVTDNNGNGIQVSLEEYYKNKSLYKTNMSGKTTLKDFNGETLRVNLEDVPNYKDMVSASTREKWYIDINTNMTFKLLPNNPITLQCGIMQIPKKKFVYRDSFGNFYYEYANSDFVATKIFDDIFPVLDDLVTVYTPQGKKIRTHKSDVRISTGEYTLRRVYARTNKGYIPTKDSCGNIFYVKTSDPRIKSGELKRTLDGYVAVKDSQGNRFSVDASDPRLKTGELVGANKNTSPYQNITTGKISMLSPDDVRITDGTHVKFDVKEHRNKLRNRPEVQELLKILKVKNLKMRMSWTYAKDITKARDYILNSPALPNN